VGAAAEVLPASAFQPLESAVVVAAVDDGSSSLHSCVVAPVAPAPSAQDS